MRSAEDIKRSLQLAYFGKEDRPSGDGWRADTLRQIRLIGPLTAVPEGRLPTEQMVWRFAGAVSVLALATAVYYLGYGTGVGYELTRLFVDDPVGLSLIQSFGMF
jgi:hypothetical protein